MASLENVEKLRERANVSYEEAKAALEACGDNLLDAMIYLENQGKVAAPSGGGNYNSEKEKESPPQANELKPEKEPTGETFSQVMGRFFRFCGKLLHKGNTNLFNVWRHGNLLFSLPVTVLVILIICFSYVILPLLIVGLFFGFRYRFSGSDLEETMVNRAMESAARAAESIKDDLRTDSDGSDGH